MAEHLSETLSRLLVQQASDAIIFANAEGLIRVWNPGAEAVFGYSTQEAVGQTLDLVVPERFRDSHWAGFRRAVGEGASKYGRQLLPTRSARKDGTTIYLELSLAVIKGEKGQVAGVLAIARDITERRAQERALRDRVAELEKQAAS